MNPDKLRMNPAAVRFVKAFVDGKPIAAICHGPWTLIEAVLCGRPSLATDLRNAGAQWTDAECIVDNGPGHIAKTGRYLRAFRRND